MKGKIVSLLIAVLLVAGLGFALYPWVSNYLFEREARQAIESFDESVSEEVLQQLRQDMRDYNETIYREGQAGLADPFFYETKAFDLSEYGLEDDLIGHVRIPRMDIEMPVYLGATKENMALGVANLGETSIPLGGMNTNAVLSAHRGYKTMPFFRDIESLELGDRVYVTNFWETIAYEVVETKVIVPDEIDEVRIQEGRDMITLLTCHPYTQNYQRYLVYCERVDLDSEREDPGPRVDLSDLSDSQKRILLERFAPLVIILGTVLFGLFGPHGDRPRV